MSRQIENGETEVIRPNTIEHWQCCDCGLVHTYFFTYEKGKIYCQTFRNDYRTKKARRRRKK